MRMLLNVRIPPQEFNAALRNGNAGQRLRQILAETKPEAVYFTEQHGQRGAVLVVDMEGPHQIPAFVEPWFLSFNADVEIHVAMTPEDLQRAGLEDLGKRWAKTSS